jgi:hypothetical protein
MSTAFLLRKNSIKACGSTSYLVALVKLGDATGYLW